MDKGRREDLKAYFKGMSGPENWGQIPLLEAPPQQGGMSGAPKSGLEIVKIAGENKEGIFLQLLDFILRHSAMHYGFPLDMLATESSNRATIEVAEQIFDEMVINRFHEMFENGPRGSSWLS